MLLRNSHSAHAASMCQVCQKPDNHVCMYVPTSRAKASVYLYCICTACKLTTSVRRPPKLPGSRPLHQAIRQRPALPGYSSHSTTEKHGVQQLDRGCCCFAGACSSSTACCGSSSSRALCSNTYDLLIACPFECLTNTDGLSVLHLRTTQQRQPYHTLALRKSIKR